MVGSGVERCSWRDPVFGDKFVQILKDVSCRHFLKS